MYDLSRGGILTTLFSCTRKSSERGWGATDPPWAEEPLPEAGTEDRPLRAREVLVRPPVETTWSEGWFAEDAVPDTVLPPEVVVLPDEDDVEEDDEEEDVPPPRVVARPPDAEEVEVVLPEALPATVPFEEAEPVPLTLPEEEEEVEVPFLLLTWGVEALPEEEEDEPLLPDTLPEDEEEEDDVPLLPDTLPEEEEEVEVPLLLFTCDAEEGLAWEEEEEAEPLLPVTLRPLWEEEEEEEEDPLLLFTWGEEEEDAFDTLPTEDAEVWRDAAFGE